MMRMKNIKKYLGLFLLLVITGVMHSCIKENLAENPEKNGTANVNLVLSSRAGEFDGDEDIKTLRLLVIDNNGTINFNRQINPTGLPNNSVSFILVGLEMGSGTKNFYVIANEESIGLDAADFESNYAEKKQLHGDWQTELKSLPIDEEDAYFPQQASGIGTSGLPITGYTEDFLIEKDQNNHVEIDITYAVSKIKLKFVNERPTKETVSNIIFQNVAPKGGTTLFDLSDLSTSLPVGEGDAYLGDVAVPAATGEQFGNASSILYVYENQKSQDGYSFTAQWNEKTQKVNLDNISFTDENGIPQKIGDLPRGRQLNITVTLKQGTVEGLDLTFEVIPWETKDIEVPPFQ